MFFHSSLVVIINLKLVNFVIQCDWKMSVDLHSICSFIVCNCASWTCNIELSWFFSDGDNLCTRGVFWCCLLVVLLGCRCRMFWILHWVPSIQWVWKTLLPDQCDLGTYICQSFFVFPWLFLSTLSSCPFWVIIWLLFWLLGLHSPAVSMTFHKCCPACFDFLGLAVSKCLFPSVCVVWLVFPIA